MYDLVEVGTILQRFLSIFTSFTATSDIVHYFTRDALLKISWFYVEFEILEKL